MAEFERALQRARYDRGPSTTLAGIERTREGLERLQGDPHPLARAVATCALLRRESRGAHRRTDFPATDPALDGHHVVVAPGGAPAFEAWA